MNRRLSILLFAVCLVATPASGQQPSGAQPGWANPGVWKSNSVSVETEADIRNRKLLVQSDSAVCSDGAVRITASLFTDKKGRVRKYIIAGGHDDAYVAVWYYYDVNGVLRKSIANLGAVNGTTQSTVFYFDSSGAPIAKTNDLISGPGFPSPTDSVIRDPRADFRSLCGPPSESRVR